MCMYLTEQVLSLICFLQKDTVQMVENVYNNMQKKSTLMSDLSLVKSYMKRLLHKQIFFE